MNGTTKTPDQPVTGLLEHLRKSQEYAGVFDWDAQTAESAVFAVGRPILNRAGIVRVHYINYGWFLRELSRLLRTRSGEDLAVELEASLVKWSGWGLSRALLEHLILECWEKARPGEEDEGSVPGVTDSEPGLRHEA